MVSAWLASTGAVERMAEEGVVSVDIRERLKSFGLYQKDALVVSKWRNQFQSKRITSQSSFTFKMAIKTVYLFLYSEKSTIITNFVKRSSFDL